MNIDLQPNIDKELIPILDEVADPEIPVLTVLDLGVIREAIMKDGKVLIKLTPTYSGCPAMDVIGDDLKAAFKKNKMEAEVELVLSPAWTTDWMSENGKRKMEEYGIAAPLDETADKEALLGNKRIVKCTNCGSTNTKLVSQFGSTACKALFQCEDCQEPFDYFKCLK
ncbi:MAG: phenylacetate-CoA oxygenase subunit PaaJ [Bacteroidia bacterium]|nr:phenylacetate-CoA oxygenase subunit PaaJ [Bacteroidia bacterium]NNF29803.1 phenylacetate-CoA oxygenase subunit PaaJ [Flavobacteriaceae bacterium]MBT8275997.1 phenylacetate-CoA oxygenase subunit PaaJ [Bacteroidia bacterium]NNJ82589.1 phenylacetate-CoA oxygenase subunit PaaJ [Flavobacteriaceae bacterium]NNK55345.1 phenylacetate-CoA oxygenase subunit PaaJ [Flavobacteriaceae bacterium]